MQDEFNINDDLAEKGWQQMSALLDQEMPVQKKRRGFWWWRWTLIVLLIGFLGGGSFLLARVLGDPTPVEQPAPKPVLPEEPSKKPAVSPAVAESEVFETEETVLPQGQVSSHSISTQETLQTKPNNLPDGASLIINEEQQEESTIAFSNEQPSPAQDIAPPLATTVSLTETLPSLSPASLELSGKPSAKIAEASTLSPWAGFVRVGMHSQQSVANGFSAGVGIARDLAGPWSLQAALDYQRLTKDPYAGNLYQEEALSLWEDEFVNGIPINSATESTFFTDRSGRPIPPFALTQLHYLRLPIQVGYQVSPRVKVLGGIATAGLIATAPSSSGLLQGLFIQSDDDALYDVNQGSEPDPTLQNYVANAAPVLWDFQFNVATEVALTPQLGAYAQVNWGMIDYQPQLVTRQFNRTAEVGLQWSF
jgi:hypothetical protein